MEPVSHAKPLEIFEINSTNSWQKVGQLQILSLWRFGFREQIAESAPTTRVVHSFMYALQAQLSFRSNFSYSSSSYLHPICSSSKLWIQSPAYRASIQGTFKNPFEQTDKDTKSLKKLYTSIQKVQHLSTIAAKLALFEFLLVSFKSNAFQTSLEKSGKEMFNFCRLGWSTIFVCKNKIFLKNL